VLLAALGLSARSCFAGCQFGRDHGALDPAADDSVAGSVVVVRDCVQDPTE